MIFAVILYANEHDHEIRSAEVAEHARSCHAKFQAHLRNAQGLGPGALLGTTEDAVHIRTRGGREEIGPGPAVETQEALHGFYLIEAENLEEAVAAARMLPHDVATVEVRPIRFPVPAPSFCP